MKKTFLLAALIAAFLIGTREVAVQASLPQAMPYLNGQERMILAGVEMALPMFVETFDNTLARYLEVVGEEEVSRFYDDRELSTALVQKVQRQHPGTMGDPLVRIRSDGFHGSMKLSIGGIDAKIQGKIDFEPVNGRLHVKLRELYLNGMPILTDQLGLMEREINGMIDSHKFQLNVKEFSTREGNVLISIETR